MDAPSDVAVVRSDSSLERIKAILDKLDVMYGIDWYKTQTTGNMSRAFRPSSTFTLHNASAGYKDRFGDVDVNIQTSLRWTDDITIDRSRDFRIMSFVAALDRPDAWHLRIGDIFPNLSPYTFTRSARTGAHGWYDWAALGGTVRLTGAAGVINRQQEYTGGTEAGQYRRWASGGGLDWLGDGPGPLGKLQVGLRASSVHDDGSSLTNRRGSGATPIAMMDIDVYSFRYEAELPGGFSWRGENAYSNGNRDLTKTPSLQHQGTAHNTALDWSRPSSWGDARSLGRLLAVRCRADYELVDPYFLTELGSASVDQMRWGTSSDFRWSENLDWTASFLRNEDNVRNRLAAGATVPVTNINRTTSVRLNARPFALSQLSFPAHLMRLRYSAEFRYNDRDASNNSANQKIEDYIQTVTYDVAGINLTGDYKWQLRDDDIMATNDRRMDEWGVRASRPFTYSVWEIRITPSVGYRNSVDKTLRGDNLTHTRSTNFGLMASWGEFTVQTGYTIMDVDRNLAAADVVNRQFTGSIGFRPVFLPDLNMTFSFRHQDVKEQIPANSYREIETKAHVDYRF